MARRKSDPVLQKLRQLAHAGRRKEAAALLEATIQNDPKHEKAREELARFLRGRPFSFEEREYSELQKIVEDFQKAPQALSHARRPVLNRLRHRIHHLEKSLSHLVTPADRKSMEQMRAAITRELQRRKRPIARISFIIAVGIAVTAALGGGSYILWQRAGKAAEALAAAAGTDFQLTRAIELLKVHDTGLNRTLNRRVGEHAEQLRLHIRRAEQLLRDIDATLRKIESGRQSVVGIGVHQRISIERSLKALGRDAADLHSRWAELCRKEQNELKQQRLSLLEELMAPLPGWQGLTGDSEKDIPLLRSRMKTLQQRISIFEDAAGELQLPDSFIAAARQELDDCHQLQYEATAFKHLLQSLPEAWHYDRYRQLLEDFAPVKYQPATDLMTVKQHLPSETNLRTLMQEHGHDLPPGLLQNAQGALMDGQPSFSPAFPAKPEQLHRLRELQTNSALFTKLYELTNTADGLHAYSEELPQLKYGRACFNRSSLDPERDVEENKAVEWQNPNMVGYRTLDPRSLSKAIGLDNKVPFSSSLNLPKALTQVLQHEQASVPALAKAYVFHHLLQVNALFSPSLLNGLRFAPEMRSVVESFEKLRQECQVELDGNCWLRHTEAHAIAEIKYARWFKKHRKVDFVAELRKNLKPLLRVSPRFCGYINENGEAVLNETVEQNQLIWYLSDGTMTTTNWGQPLQKPMKLSPVFTMAK